MKHYLYIFMAAILLTACQKESALQQFEQKLVLCVFLQFSLSLREKESYFGTE